MRHHGLRADHCDALSSGCEHRDGVQIGHTTHASEVEMNRLRFGLSLALASACALLPARAASAVSGVVGHVYVNDNTRGVNTIGAFDRHADGTLTPMRG